MIIGLTYDLRDDYLAMGLSPEEAAEFDQPATIEGIAAALARLGHVVDRVGHIKSLARRLSAGERWDLVFNIAEGFRGIGREAQAPALLDAFDVPYTMSDPLVCAVTLHKAMAKRIVRDLGVPTPAFAVVEQMEDVGALCEAESEFSADRIETPRHDASSQPHRPNGCREGAALGYPLFVKPLAEGTSKGIDGRSVVRGAAELRASCANLLARFNQPVLVERFLPGREVTVGVLGTGARARVVGVMEVRLREGADQDVYSFENKERSEDLVEYSLVEGGFAREASELALRVWRGLGCRDAGRVDLRENENGRLSFLEVNPLPGLHPTHSDLPIMASLAGMSFESLIGAIVASAMERMPRAARRERA